MVTTGTVASGWGFRTISRPLGLPNGRLKITGWIGFLGEDNGGPQTGSVVGRWMTCISCSLVLDALMTCGGRLVTTDLAHEMLVVGSVLLSGSVAEDDRR